MAVFEMLPEVVCPEELLAGIALAELVHVLQMPDTVLPILLTSKDASRIASCTGKFFTAIATRISLTRPRAAVVECAIVSLKR